jgi:hypothetical protein
MSDHSWIRKIFKNKFTSFMKHKKTKVNTKLSLLPLEERLVPAVPFVQTPFGANIQPLYDAFNANAPYNGNPTFTENPSYKVTFNYPVTGVDVNDFKIDVVNLVSGTPTPSITQITPSQYLLTVAVPANSAEGPRQDGNSGTRIYVELNGNATIFPQASFAPKGFFAVGSFPHAVTLGDVNGDGKMDIVSANFSANTVSVRLGNGDGTFGTKRDFTTGTGPASVTLGDVNRDGKLDIVSANSGSSHTVSVLLGNGNGFFGLNSDFGTGKYPTSVTLGDVNGDGKMDIISANSGITNTVSVLLGNGNGSFGPKNDFGTGAQAYSVTLGDVNGDGKLDIVSANRNANTVSVLLGNGNGAFGPKTDFSTGTRPNSVTLGDVNGDGKLDIVAANSNTNNVSLLLGNGNGTFAPKVDFGTGANPRSVTLGDVNGDGKLDIVSANYQNDNASILLGNGNGTFQPQQAFATGSGPASVFLGDVNNDGRLDIATANLKSSTVSILLASGGNGEIGLSSGEPTSILRLNTTSSPLYTDVQFGDFNRDGKQDIISVGSGANLTINLGNGDGTYKAAAQVDATKPNQIRIADVNNDGKLDIIGSSIGLGNFLVYAGNGDGKFKSLTSISSSKNNYNFELVDINNDGNLDIVTQIGNGSTTGTNGVGVMLGNGNGVFKAQTTFNLGTGITPVNLAVGDVNGDGKLDIVTANYQNKSASILLGNGNGTFTISPTTVGLGDGPKMVALADMNNDGKLDLVSVNYLGNNISIALGNGNGTFLPAVHKATIYQPKQLKITDMNGDGKLDVLVGGGQIWLHPGNGDGTLGNKTNLFLTSITAFAVADVNNNGVLDLAVVGSSNASAVQISSMMKSLSSALQNPIAIPPYNPSATNGNAMAAINFTAVPPETTVNIQVNGQLTPTEFVLSKYEYSLDGVLLPVFASQPGTPPAGPYIVTQTQATSGTVYGLTNGTVYTLKVRGVYTATGFADMYTSHSSVQLSPTAVPPTPAGPAPVLSSATSITNNSAIIAFTQPSGTPTGYQYNLNNTSWQSAGTTSPLTLTNLTPGTIQSVRLRAVYSVNQGANPNSDASNEINFTTKSAPLAPLNLVATPGVGSATITFTAPSDGGSPITNYEYQVGTGTWTALSPVDTTSPVTITGLTGGTALSIKLRGVNSYGGGIQSSAVSVTPIGAPAAPTNTSVANSNGKATISFSINDGGAPITSIEYQISSNGGTSYSPWAPFSPVDATSPVTLSGLTNGSTYLVKLRGINNLNLTGAESTAIAIAPVAVAPDAPTSLMALSGNGSATIYFTEPDNGGSPITNYQYSTDGINYTAFTPVGNSVLIPTLTNGTSYTITLKAVNAIGASVASTSVQVTPSSAKPVFVNGNTASFKVGTPASFSFMATGSPTYTMSSVPSGLAFVNGVLSGTPTGSGIYNFTVDATNSSGTTTQAFTLTITGVPQFTTNDGTLFTQNRALSYTVSANDPNNPIANTEIFNSNFSALPNGWTAQGNAAIVNGVMQLTAASFSQLGVLKLPSLGENNPNAFYAKFDLIATGGTGADGTSFNYGVPDSLVNVSNYAELTILSNTGLSIGFVEYQNQRVEIRYNGNLLATVFTPIESPTGRNVEVLVDNAGKLTLWMDGKAITTVDLGSAYTSAAKNNWQFGFGARTASFTNRHEIDNLSISSVGISYSTGQSSFASDFSTLPTDWQIGGDASVTGGYLQLNPSPGVGGAKSGYLVLPAMGNTSLSAFGVSFNYLVSNETDDGLGTTLNYGVIPPSPSVGDFGDLRGSSPIGLAITFSEDETDSITVKFNGNSIYTLVEQQGIYVLNQFNPIRVTMTEAGYLTITVNGNTVVKNLLVPDFAIADKSNWKFGFGAKSMNFFNNASLHGDSSHTIDNLQISGLQSLPAGIRLNPLTGLLSGTPTGNASSYGFNIVSTNSAGTATQAFTMVNTTNQPASPGGTYREIPIEGSTTGKTYQLAPGYTLPPGMFLTPQGVLRGTVPQHERGSYLVKFVATNTSTQAITTGYYPLTFGAPTATVSSTPFADPNPGVGNGFGSYVVPLATGNVLVHSPSAFSGKGALYLFNGYTGNLISSLVGTVAGDLTQASITALDNGNAVVKFDKWDNGGVVDAGAVMFVDGSTGWGTSQQSPATISAANALVGSTKDDLGSFTTVTKLPGGDYLVQSKFWDNGAAVDAGAVTWGSGVTGVSGVISSTNSLVGTSKNDSVGFTVQILSNGNYLVQSYGWDNGTATDAGAVTFGNGKTGVRGVVSSANSLVGTSVGDNVGALVQILTNGNYLVQAPKWDNGATVDAGAVTWGSGVSGISGAISNTNSLVGTNSKDQVGSSVELLANGNFVVMSQLWNSQRGAFTWGDGKTGITGDVSATNSLVGSSTNDASNGIIMKLSNGNYVILNSVWNNGSMVDAGAVTWGSGTSGVRGVISAANSLVGSSSNDYVGYTFTELSNGNFVVSSKDWNNGTTVDVGAVTWVDGTRGITGTISAANSLVGSKTSDAIGFGGITTLTNGNFVVISPYWSSSTITGAGAVTFGDGTKGITGTISINNSLVGTTANQFTVGVFVTALSNGNYVVATPSWDNGSTVDVGALTWASGTTGLTGTITASNSLIGTKTNDLKTPSSRILPNGNVLFNLSGFDNGTVVDAGALVWMNGSQPTTGVIGNTNSLVGGTTGDFGSVFLFVLPNGNYVASLSKWDNGSIADAGAVSWGNGATGTFGTISASNSLVGTTDKLGNVYFNLLKGSSNYLLANSTGSVNGVTSAGWVTWANGDIPVTGTVSAANSLVGSAANDRVGNSVIPLNNGNYIIGSNVWNGGAGAVTLGKGSTGIFGTINEQNSLVGSSKGDGLGVNYRLTPDNKILFTTTTYDDPNRNLANVGAVTLFDGNTGTTGVINSTNSYIGNNAGSIVGTGIRATYDSYNKTYYAYFANETVAGFSNNGAINPSVIVPNVNTAPSFTSANSASFTVGNNDSFQFASKGIPEEITYALQAGNLPNGISLSPQGLLSGTGVTNTGATYTFTVRATNTTGFTDQVFTLTMREAPVIISNTPLPSFVTNNSSTYTFSATGFPAPIFSTFDALPKGVTLSSTGVLTGTPVSGTEGTYEFTVIATGGDNLVAKRTFTLTVNSEVAITSADGTSAHNGTASTFQVKTTGAPPASTFSLTGSVPTGVTIDNTGLISIASTTVAGNYSFTVNASNGFGTPATQTFSLEVFGPPSITSQTSTNFTIGTVGSFPFTASGNPNTFTFSTSDALPAGLALSSLGVLSGTPEDGSSGSFTVDVKAFNGVSSTSQSFTIQVAKATSSVGLGLSSSGSINPGTDVTLTATVTGGSIPKGGIMTFKDGSTVIGTAKVDPTTGIAIFTTNSLASGSHSLTAEYSGNSAYLGATSNSATQLVRTVSTTTVTSNNLNVAYQASVTFTATISNSSATGTVDFFDGSTRIAQGVALSGGVATFTTSTLSAGPHSITASYNGDNNFTTSTSSAISQSVIATSNTALSSSASGAVNYNTAVTFTATVTGSAGTPTGTVQFYLDDAPLGTPVTLNAGVAVYTSLVNSGSNSNVPLPAGSLNIKAVYSGNGSYSNSTSLVVNQVVNATTATTVSSSTASTLLGSTATFVARVTNTAGSPAPTSANVSFYDGSTLLGTITANPVASTNYIEATYTITSLTAGSHSIVAKYAGNPQTFFSNSESSALSHSVVLNTTTTVTATPANAYQNDNVTFTATVARTSAGATPTGSVTFFSDNIQLGAPVALVNGVATYTAQFANPSTQSIVAKYSGDNGVTSTSEGSISKQILETQTTSTALASSANPSANGSAVTFTATVSTATGTPTGTVTFFDGATQLGSAVTLVNGVATLQTSALSNGDHLISAVYTSNANAFGTSTSTKLNQRVNQAPTITSPASESFLINTSHTFTFNASGFPSPSFSTLGILPKGLHLTSAGVLSGTPVAGTGGTYTFAVVASNDFGQDASVNFTLTVQEPASFTNANATTFTAGLAESFKLSAKGFPAATFRVASTSTLPSGLNITSSVVNGETVWAISGTPAVNTGRNTPYTFVLEAVNNVGTAATQTFSLTINEPPSITSLDYASFTIGSYTNSFTVTAAGFPAPSIKLMGDLPAGLKFNNGVLSGTPLFGSERSYNLKFVASNGFGDVAIQDFTLNILQVDPTLVCPSTTNDRTPSFSGTAEPNSQIEVIITRVGSPNSTTVFKTTAGPLNTENLFEPSQWSIDMGTDTPDSGFLKSLADGDYIVMVSAIDGAGNRTSSRTGNGTIRTFTVDATPPPIPVIGLASVSDTGVLGDKITSVTRPTISGTAEANSAITLTINELVFTTTANGSGAWAVNLANVNPTGSLSPMAVLADGKYEVSVTATDSFGNTSESGIMTLVIDSTAPIAPAITSALKTSDTTPLISGTAEANSTVTVVVTHRDSTNSTISGPATFVVNADANGAWSLDLGTAVATSGSIQVFANNAENYLINANARDAAGNQNSGATGTQTLIFDRDIPLVLSNKLTNRSFPLLSGKANAGDTLLVVLNSVTYSTPVSAQGLWLLDTATATVVTGTRAAFADGVYPVSVYYQGANPSSAVVAQNLEVDRTAPVISSVTSSFGTILNQKNSNQPATLEILITGIENEQPVTVSLDGATYTGTVFNGLAKVIVPESALSSQPDGANKTILVSTTDRAGNPSLPFSFNFSVDKSGPACPSFVSITTTPNGDIGTTPFTGYTQPVVTFRGEPGQTLLLYGPSGIISTDSYTVVETADTTNTNQQASFYVITFNSPQASGDYQIKLIDQNGNENANETSANKRANNFFNINSVPVVFDNQSLRSTQNSVTTGNLQVGNVLNGQMFTVVQDPTTQQLVNPRLQADGTWIDLDGESVTFGLSESSVIERDNQGNPTMLRVVLANESSLILNVQTGAYIYTPTAGPERTDVFQVSVKDATGNISRLQLSFNTVDTLDRDGIEAHSENAIANLGGNNNGDLNNDGTADNRQASVSNLAWRTQQDYATATNPDTVQNTNPAAIITMVVNATAFDPSTTTTLAQLMGNVDPLAQLLQIGVLSTNGLVADQPNLYKPWDVLDFTVESLVSTGLNDINPSRDGNQIQVSIDISRANIPISGLGFSMYRKYISPDVLSAYADAGISLTDLTGTPITTAGWYDFTQRTPGGDGASFKDFNNDGKVDAIILTLTDNSFGDNNPIANKLRDPGTPGSTIQSNPGGPNPSVPTPPGSNPPSPAMPGFIVSSTGPSATTIWAYNANSTIASNSVVPFAGFRGEVRIARADINQDGISDIIAAKGPGGSPSLKVINGATFGTLLEMDVYDKAFTGGIFVTVGDIDGNGTPEIITGAGAGGGPHVKILNALTGAEISSFFAYDSSFSGGISVAAFDLEGNGLAEIVTGAGPGGGPHVKVFDPISHQVIKEFMAYDPSFRNGIFVAAGDYLSDGKREIVTGAGPGGGPHVKIWDYLTLNIDGQFMAYGGVTDSNGHVIDQLFSCGVRVALVDVNGDNINDIITAPGFGGAPHVKAFAGFELDLILGLFAGDEYDRNGMFAG